MKKSISIRFKIRTSFIIIISLFMCVSILSFINIKNLIQVNSQNERSYTILSKLDEVSQVKRNILSTLQDSGSVSPADISSKIKTVKDTYLKDIKDIASMTAGDNRQQELLKNVEDVENKDFDTISAKIDEINSNGGKDMISALRELMAPPKEGSTETGSNVNSSNSNMAQMDKSIEQMREIENQNIQSRDNQIRLIYKITLGVLAGGTLISVLLALFIMLLMDFTVVGGIRKTSDMLRDIAEGEGDLTKRLEVKSNDELGDMAKWFNSFIDKISGLLGEVISSTNSLSHSTQEVLLSIEESNSGMIEVVNTIEKVNNSIQTSAGASEEAMSSIEEMAIKAGMIQTESQNVNERGEEVLGAVAIGEVAVSDAVAAIDTVKATSVDVLNVISDLKKASNEIGQIVSLMRGITEQTGLLALNASIEAARAGEAGRGFAVVADEVKKLAEESNGSAEEITHIVNDIQIKIQKTENAIIEEQTYIDTSVDKVSRTSEEFDKISKYIQSISEKIASVTTASEQQSGITKEMTQTINILTEGLQSNAAASEEIDASIDEQVNTYKSIEQNMEGIRNIANNLKKHTDRFKL